MRWSLIASGFLLTALLRFAFGHSEAPPRPEPLRVPVEAPAAPRPERPPLPTPTSNGPSILSLLEIGPAEEQKEVAASPRPAKRTLLKAEGSVVILDPQEAIIRQQRRLDRMVLRAARLATETALESCAKLQLARNPRLTGQITVTATVGIVPGIERGVLLGTGVDTANLFVPLFTGCIQNELAAASLPKPTSQLQFSYVYTLEQSPEDSQADSDDDDSEDADQSET